MIDSRPGGYEGRKGTDMVSTYKARLCDAEKHGEIPMEIELQALSAQNMADAIRNLYGEKVQILEICEIREDWK